MVSLWSLVFDDDQPKQQLRPFELERQLESGLVHSAKAMKWALWKALAEKEAAVVELLRMSQWMGAVEAMLERWPYGRVECSNVHLDRRSVSSFPVVGFEAVAIVRRQ